jgi:hypothetical protein
MFSHFVKGMMCATLMFLGLSGCLGFIQNLSRHAPAAYLIWYAPAILVVALALLLLTSSLVIARVAFWILLIGGLAEITAPLHAWPQEVYHISKFGSIFYGIVFLFPCVVAMLNARRKVTPSV